MYEFPIDTLQKEKKRYRVGTWKERVINLNAICKNRYKEEKKVRGMRVT
jgi:uncharacterized protein YueI